MYNFKTVFFEIVTLLDQKHVLAVILLNEMRNKTCSNQPARKALGSVADFSTHDFAQPE
jgi:hypothetical protein